MSLAKVSVFGFIIFLFLSCQGEGLNEGVVEFTEMDSVEFKHITRVYHISNDSQSFEFCEEKLSEEELDTLEDVLFGAAVSFRRSNGVIMVPTSDVKDMLKMSSIDGELRHRMKYPDTICPDMIEVEE